MPEDEKIPDTQPADEDIADAQPQKDVLETQSEDKGIPDAQPKEDVLETQSEDEGVPDAQPKEDILETQSKDEEIPKKKSDEKRKETWSRPDLYNFILACLAFVLSVISLFVDVIQAFPRESIQILRAEDDGYYHFDGKTLFKNYQVTVANNSAIPVSVVEITIERDGEKQTFKISDLPDILPLNMESNHTEMITIPWNIKISEENAQKLQDMFASDDKASDKVLSSKPELVVGAIADSSAFQFTSNLIGIYSFTEQETLTLSVILGTAKDNQYVLTTTDTGAPKFEISESAWVASQILEVDRIEGLLSIRDFIEKMRTTQNTE